MKRHQAPTADFEVWCDRCGTSFAAGTKRCIHCGGRLARRGGRRGLRAAALSQELDLPDEVEDVMMDEAASPARRSFSPLTLVWIAVLLGGYLFQLCAQR